jgi:tRNA modification GTPase
MLLTPPGSAAIAVLRLSGPNVESFLRSHFSGPLKPGRCVHGTLSDGPRVIDDPVVIISVNGQVADVNLHGGPWVVRSALELAKRSGFAIIEPRVPLADEAVDGETEIEREVVRHLPLATTELAMSEILRQQEAWERFELQPAAERRAEAKAMLSDQGLWWLLHPPRVAIAGAANVGKSTLANQLFGQERSITADLPGTTRDWVGELANLDGLAVMLVDTPGIRATSDQIESSAIERASEEVRSADLIVLVLDASRPLNPEQSGLRNLFPTALVVVNKCDLSAAWDWRSIDSCQTVATSGSGVPELQKKIKAIFEIEARRELARCWTERQRKILEQPAAP